MERQYLLGNEAIAHACLESGIGFVSGYPGTPSSEVVDALRVQKDPAYHGLFVIIQNRIRKLRKTTIR